MYTIEIDVDDTIYDTMMGLFDILPEDKIEVKSHKKINISFKESKQPEKSISAIELRINALLEEANLLHFKFFEDPNRILYTRESGTSTHVQDFHKLVRVLKRKNIKFDEIGVDAIMIEED